jgi:hypothetical protein
MIQNFIKAAMFSAVQKWLNPATSPAHPNAPFHPNLSKIKQLSIHYASLFTLLFLNFSLFIGGLVVTAVATAHSFDVFGHFQTTAVFWTGIVMGATGLVIAAIAAIAIGKTEVKLNDVLYVEPEVEAITVVDRLVRPFFEGVLDGLRAPPRTARYQGGNESYPAA